MSTTRIEGTNCLNCAKVFIPTVPWQKFCRRRKNKCHDEWHAAIRKKDGMVIRTLEKKLEQVENYNRQMRADIEILMKAYKPKI